MAEDEYDWQGLYEANDMRWDLGEVAPPFKKLLEAGKLPVGKVLIPGCGRGHEVMYLAQNGFDVTGVDFAEGATSYLEKSLKERNLKGRVVHQNFFTLDDRHTGVYDLVLEQTFFCAINPSLRPDYCQTVGRLLKPGGKLIGLFYNTGEEGGPPYNTTREEIESTFSKTFTILALEKTTLSIEKRMGKEWLVIMQKL
ncbi:MAG: methyltransferase domain-containing protein [Nitrospinales bacterium]